MSLPKGKEAVRLTKLLLSEKETLNPKETIEGPQILRSFEQQSGVVFFGTFP